MNEDEAKRLILASGSAGIMAENVNLFCSSFNLYTALRINFDRDKLFATMKLEQGKKILFAQSVGEPLTKKKNK